MSDELKNFMSKDRMSQISRKWKELSDEEKSKYNLGAKEVSGATNFKLLHST